MFNICVNFKDTKILKSSVYFQSLYDTLHIVYQLSEIKDHIQGIYLFECVLGHPCNKFKKYKEITNVQCSWLRNIYNTLNYIRSKCVSSCPPPPSPPLLVKWRAASVSFKMSRCEHLRSGTTNSFILPQMPTLGTLATNAANV